MEAHALALGEDGVLVAAIERGPEKGERVGGRLAVHEIELGGAPIRTRWVDLPPRTWNVTAAAYLSRPTVVLDEPAASGSRALLWVELGDRDTATTLHEVPAELSYDDEVLPGGNRGHVVGYGDGFLRLVTVSGEPAILRVNSAGIDAWPVAVPEGSSRYELAASPQTARALLVAFGFEGSDRVEASSFSPTAMPATWSWTRIADREPTRLTVAVGTEGATMTFVDDGELEALWLGIGLEIRARAHLSLELVDWALVVGASPSGLVATRRLPPADYALLFASLTPSGRAEGLRSLLDYRALDVPSTPSAIRRGDGSTLVAQPTFEAIDVFVLCEGATP